MENIEYVLPGEIEKRSFAIIEEELKERGIVLPPEQELVTKRVIHTSADFDYAKTMTYSPHAVQIAKELIAGGADIVTDTNMALAGINKKRLAEFGGTVHCFMADEDVAREAKTRQVTRATVSMEHAANIDKPVIFAVGNAPTALISLYELMQKSDWRPAFIIGVPVGFVNVEAAKELILKTDVPHIVNRGRKGGIGYCVKFSEAVHAELVRHRDVVGDRLEFYLLLNKMRWYLVYLRKSHNPWAGDTEFARGINAEAERYRAELEGFFSRCDWLLLRMDRRRWMRPGVLAVSTLMRWGKSLKRRLTR